MFTLLVVAVLLGYHIDNTPTSVQAEPVAVQPVASKYADPEPVVAVEKYPTLVADMNAVIAASPDLSASATFIDLDTSEHYNAGNYTQKYEAASTAKLVSVFDYINQVEQGKATLDKTIQDESALDIIQSMLVYSDNDAWDKLNSYLKFKPQQAYLDSIGVKGSMVPDNLQFATTSMARMLRLFYQGKLMNADHRAMVLGYMARSTMKSLIPAALPADAKVYNKYGQIDGVLHDAAIVEYQGHKFVLVVYTDNGGQSGQYSNQVNLIHAVTTAAFNDVVGS